MGKWCRCAAAIILVTTVAACVTTAVPRVDTAVRFFNDIGFRGSPNGTPLTGAVLAEIPYNTHALHRWAVPIRIAVTGDPAGKYSAQIDQIAAQFTKLSGVVVNRLSTDRGTPNFKINFTNDPGFTAFGSENVPCIAGTRTGSNFNITIANIRISTLDPSIINHCIAHELFHGFGFSHSNKLPSVVSSRAALRELSRWDKMAIRVLYAPELSSGMTRRQSLPIARRLILQQLALKD